MKCPHCLVAFHPQVSVHSLGDDVNSYWRVIWQKCPACSRFIILLGRYHSASSAEPGQQTLVYPRAQSRSPLSPDVPPEFARDYTDACLVAVDSPKASAALSRRCLQNLLQAKAAVTSRDLGKQIEEVLQSRSLPTHLAEGIDAVRNVGNFAAHPLKDTNTGEIVEVEPGEAEWLLDLLEGLFDFYFVQPAMMQRKREALNKKLEDIGKPPMK